MEHPSNVASPTPMVLLSSGPTRRAMVAWPGGPPYLSKDIALRLKCLTAPMTQSSPLMVDANAALLGPQLAPAQLGQHDADKHKRATDQLLACWRDSHGGRNQDGRDGHQVHEQGCDDRAQLVHAVMPKDVADHHRHQGQPDEKAIVQRCRRNEW